MYFYYIKPELVVVNNKRVEYSKYKSAINEIKEVTALRDDLASKYESIPADDLNKLDKIIPEKFDPVIFANEINTLTSKYSLKVTGLRIEYQVNDEGGVNDNTEIGDITYRTITSSFSVSGDYNTLFTFLKELESSLRLLDVTGLLVKSGVSTDSTGKNSKIIFTYDIKLKTYSLK